MGESGKSKLLGGDTEGQVDAWFQKFKAKQQAELKAVRTTEQQDAAISSALNSDQPYSQVEKTLRQRISREAQAEANKFVTSSKRSADLGESDNIDVTVDVPNIRTFAEEDEYERNALDSLHP